MRRQRILELGIVAVLAFSGMATFADLASLQSPGYLETGIGRGFATRQAWGISADRSIAAGDFVGGYHAFTGKARGLWEDGSAIAGIGGLVFTEEAFRWTAEAGMVGLGYLPGHNRNVAYDDWAGGPVVAGHSGNSRAFLWAALTGMAGLGDLRGDNPASRVYDVSADGSAVMGYGSTAAAHEALIWDQINGIRNIQVVLVREYDLGPTGW